MNKINSIITQAKDLAERERVLGRSGRAYDQLANALDAELKKTLDLERELAAYKNVKQENDERFTLQGTLMNDCIFCRIASKEIVVPYFEENYGAILINDKNPVAEKHVLVISKAHIADMNAAIPNEFQYVAAVLRLAHDYASIHLPNGYRIIVNTGDDAGQTVKHFHCHVLGGEKLKDL